MSKKQHSKLSFVYDKLKNIYHFYYLREKT